MKKLKSRLVFICIILGILIYSPLSLRAEKLPFNTVFKGTDKFYQLVGRAQKENWRSLPIGERTDAVGLALCGTPYKGFTLEIDNHIEAASVNLNGLDCWTFFEISLGFARMLKMKPDHYKPEDLLKMIELERYRGGRCDGGYLSRIHFLEELFHDNENRGLCKNITRELGGVPIQRQIREMTVAWRSYRYLKYNPSLRPQMTQIENRVSRLPVYYIPKSKVARIEPKLKDGDIIAIVCRDSGAYTSHVGLAYRDANGVLRFMHASSRHRKVLVDKELSAYLKGSSEKIGIIVARPNDLPASMAQTSN
ncbi:MAG: DUF1460 domain-containing protein [Verrucomicrobiota bacterium]|nr:DUF1460 domain-containing protein [Verrucomicrobiota bacterium]